MAWIDDKYIRTLLDARQRWGILLSMTAVAGLLLFLSDHPHRSWVNLGPLVIAAFGSFYVFVINCYYNQAEAMAYAREKHDVGELERITRAGWWVCRSHIGGLGWCHILAPVVLGGFATLTLYFGILPPPVGCVRPAMGA